MSQRLNKAKAIIEQSGNTFHCKVLKDLQKKGWKVLISPYYNDNVSSKPREIDLIAEKEFNPVDCRRTPFRTVKMKLFIECKYIPQITVFWFHSKDKPKAEYLVTRTTSLEKGYPHIKKHHYLAGVESVAKLFASEGKNSADNEIFYKALNQSLNAMVSYGKEPTGQNGYVHKTVNYPIIVCNSFDNLYRVEIDTDTEPSKITENFQLEVNYAYMTSNGNNINEYFLIDILNFVLFDNFLEKIKDDAELVHCYLSTLK